MNATLAAGVSQPQPSFVGMVRGELFKLSRQRAVVVSAIVIAAFFVVYALTNYFYLLALKDAQQVTDGRIDVPPGAVAYSIMQLLLGNVRGLLGIFVMIATVVSIALEYQQGTIRVLLARGLGRLRLLGAKLTALGIVSLLMLGVMLILSLVMAVVDVTLAFGNAAPLSQGPSYLLSDTLMEVLAVLISMATTLLFAAMFAVLGRSLAFGLSFTLPYFLLESIIGGILTVISVATKNDAWVNLTTYFLGNNITALSTALLPDRGLNIATLLSRGASALGPSIDATHALVVTGVYVAIFAGVAGYLTHRRDVLQ